MAILRFSLWSDIIVVKIELCQIIYMQWFLLTTYLLGGIIFYINIKTELKPEKWVRAIEFAITVFWPIVCFAVLIAVLVEKDSDVN